MADLEVALCSAIDEMNGGHCTLIAGHRQKHSNRWREWAGPLAPEVPPRRENIEETVARAIYEDMRMRDSEGRNTPWVPRGNSLKQNEARQRARAALAATPEPPDSGDAAARLAERLRPVLINRGINPAFADELAAAVFAPGNAVADSRAAAPAEAREEDTHD